MRKAPFIFLLIAIIGYPSQVSSAGLAASVFVNAKPSAIIADGKSVATITAEVRDSSGDLVPDGTLVSFSSNIGTIQTSVTTTAGVARARLTSGTAVGTAVVSAWVTQVGAVGQISVELLAPGTEISRQSFITISSGTYLVYDSEKMIVYAAGGAKVVHRGLSITADEVELDVQTGLLKCRRRTGGDPIKLTRGKRSLDASVLAYRITDMKGKAITDSESGSVTRIAFRGSDLAFEPDTDYTPENYFDFTDLSESVVLVKASSITVRPGEEIHFRRAKFYVDGKKMLAMPLHVLPIGASAGQESQYLGWGTNGLRVDMPVYYSLSPSSTGSLHLRRGQQTGWGFYSGNSGWSLDMVEDYTTDSGGEGNLALSRITGGDWGAHWDHNQEYDSGSHVYSYIDFPAHRDLFGMVNLTKPLSLGSLGVNFYGNKYRGQSGSLSTDVYLQSVPKPIAGGTANYVMLARTSLATGSGVSGGGLGAGLQMQVFGKPISFSDKTRLNSSFSFGHDWGGTRSGLALFGNASLTHRLNKTSNAGLMYSYTSDSSNSGQYGKHRLSANLFYAPSKRWQVRAFTTYTLDQSLSSTFADLSYQIRPGWRLSCLETIQKFNQYEYSDLEVALGKEIGNHEVMLVWSQSRNKLRMEFNAARF